MVSSIANTDELGKRDLENTNSPMATQNRSIISSSVRIENENSYMIDEFVKGIDRDKLDEYKNKKTCDLT
mgnify:CR=1 FL=1